MSTRRPFFILSLAALFVVSGVPSVWATCSGLKVNAVSTGSGTSNPITVTHSLSGTDRLLVVSVSTGNTAVPVSSVTYGGTALTSLGTEEAAARVEMWYLVDPPVGTADVVVTFSGSPSDGAVIGVTSFTGVDQTTPLGAFASDTGGGSTASVTVSSASGELVIDVVAQEKDNGINVGSGQIERWNVSRADTRGGGSTEPGASSVTMSWTSVDQDWAIGGVSVKPAPPPSPPPAFSRCDWGVRRKLTFDNSGQSENLVNFPVLVTLNSSRINYSKTQDAGEDLRFTDADGTTLLAHEIEEWNESGTSYVWVKVPQIDATNTDHIWMYYDNSSAADGQDPGDVWDNGYAGVWHVNEPSNTTRLDSTCNSNYLTDNNTVPATSTAKAADAADLERGNNEKLHITDAAQTGLDISGNITFMAWARPESTGTNRSVLDKYAGASNAYRLQFDSGRRFDCDVFNGGSSGGASTTTLGSSGSWTHVACVYDGSQVKAYADGDNEGNSSYSSGIGTNAQNFTLGAQGTGQYFDGIIDEARVSNVARSADWIKAQYLSMTDAFITYGSEELREVTVDYFYPDAAAARMSLPVNFVGSFCGSATVTTSSSDIIVGPSIVTDSTGQVTTSQGTTLSTMFFVKSDARPTSGITVTIDGTTISQTFDIVTPSPAPGSGTLTNRTEGGTTVLGGLTIADGDNLNISTSDTDAGTSGNQGHLPAVILVQGDVTIDGTLDVRGDKGADAGANCAGGEGGIGGPGGGGGGGGGVQENASCGGGQVVVDAVSSATGTSDITLSHTVSGSNRLLIVGVSTAKNSVSVVNPGGVTYGGTALTRLGFRSIGDDARIELWYLVNPPTGTANVVVDFSSNPGEGAIVGAISFTGVDQTTPLGTFASNTGSSTTASVTVSSGPGELVVDTISLRIDGISVGPGQTERWNLSRADTRGGGSTEPGASSVTMSWTSVGEDWAIGAVSVKPAPVSGIAARGEAGLSGGGGGASKGTDGEGAPGGDGTGALGSAASGTTGGNGGSALGGATGGGGGSPHSSAAGGGGGGGGTGNPFGSGGSGGADDGGAQGQGGGGGGAADTTAGGGGGGGFATAGTGGFETDSGLGGDANGNAQLMPLMGGSGGGGGGPDTDLGSRGGGGAGGGGAVLLYATGSVNVGTNGKIDVRGKNGGAGYTSGGDGSGGGGGGAGGSILLQSSDVTVDGTLDRSGGTGGTGTGSADGGAGGDGRVRIDGQSSGSTIPGTAGTEFIGPGIDPLDGSSTVTGRADGGSSITLYVYDENGNQVAGSPYSASASGSSATVGTWSISSVTFPTGKFYLAVKQSTSGGNVQIFGPGLTQGVHLINWREVY